MTTPTAGRLPTHRLVLGWPLPAVALAGLLATVGISATAYVLMVPLDAGAFGGLTIPAVPPQASRTGSTRAHSPCWSCSRRTRSRCSTP